MDRLDIDIIQYVIVLSGYIITIATSGMIVRYFIRMPKTDNLADVEKVLNSDYDLGTIIGKCENILTITLILADAYTGLALIFTAKSIVRREDMRKDPFYYLGGTLVNFSYSLMMGFFIRVILKATGHTI